MKKQKKMEEKIHPLLFFGSLKRGSTRNSFVKMDLKFQKAPLSIRAKSGQFSNIFFFLRARISFLCSTKEENPRKEFFYVFNSKRTSTKAESRITFSLLLLPHPSLLPSSFFLLLPFSTERRTRMMRAAEGERKNCTTIAENIEAKERINFKNIHFEKWHKKSEELEMIIFLLKMWQRGFGKSQSGEGDTNWVTDGSEVLKE